MKTFRAGDKTAKWAKLKAVRDLVKTANGIPLTQKKPERKRKRGGKPAVPPPIYAEVDELSDEDWVEEDDSDAD